MAVCKGCGAKIMWVQMRNGKMMPVNPAPLYYEDRRDTATVIVTEDGRISSGHTEAVAVIGSKIRGWESHFSTCPMAYRYKRKDKSC